MTPSSIEDQIAAILGGIGLVWLVATNLRAYRAFADDKRCAVDGLQRIPEHVLLNLASMGGSIGALIAQRRFRHKTRKQPFVGQMRRIAITQALMLLAFAFGVILLAGPAEASSGFSCAAPRHHDGDAIRCAGRPRSDRLYGIDAPEMPGSCRPGRACTPGDPVAARDALAALTGGRDVTCEQVDTDRYNRRIVRCVADGIDLSCAMVAEGHAVERYGRLRCDRSSGPAFQPQQMTMVDPGSHDRPARRAAGTSGEARRASPPGPLHEIHPATSGWQLASIWLLLINIAAFAAFAIDTRNAASSPGRQAARLPWVLLLGLAALGGSIGALAGQRLRGDKTRSQRFRALLLPIIVLQFVLVAGWALLLR